MQCGATVLYESWADLSGSHNHTILMVLSLIVWTNRTGTAALAQVRQLMQCLFHKLCLLETLEGEAERWLILEWSKGINDYYCCCTGFNVQCASPTLAEQAFLSVVFRVQCSSSQVASAASAIIAALFFAFVVLWRSGGANWWRHGSASSSCP